MGPRHSARRPLPGPSVTDRDFAVGPPVIQASEPYTTVSVGSGCDNLLRPVRDRIGEPFCDRTLPTRRFYPPPPGHPTSTVECLYGVDKCRASNGGYSTSNGERNGLPPGNRCLSGCTTAASSLPDTHLPCRIVFDDLQSAVRHRYDWVYHNRASGVACDVADKPVARLDPEFSGQEYLQHLQQGQSSLSLRQLEGHATFSVAGPARPLLWTTAQNHRHDIASHPEGFWSGRMMARIPPKQLGRGPRHFAQRARSRA